MMRMGEAIVTKITEKEVEHIAWLAKLELTSEEKTLFTEQFNTILNYFEVISEIDTEDIPPTTHVVEVVSNLREDRIDPSLEPEAALRNASKHERRFFKAPKIV